MGARTADFSALAAAVRRGDRGPSSATEQSVEAAQHRVRRGLHLGDFGQSRLVIAGGKEARRVLAIEMHEPVRLFEGRECRMMTIGIGHRTSVPFAKTAGSVIGKFIGDKMEAPERHRNQATLPNHMIGLGQADHFSGEIACRDAGKLLPDGGIEPIGTAGDFIDRGSVFFRPCPRCTRCSVPTTPP